MTTPTFAKTHNLIAYLVKPAESEGFEQIIDFLNGSSVRYAFTVSPTIRTSCIKQFWSTAKVKTINDEVRVQALIDGKKCLSAKTTSWNEFSSTIASTIICLTTNQKFNFSRYILLSLVKNIEARVPFYMFLRFVQLLVDHQLGDMSHHQDIYDNLSLTKKGFSNMKRVSTGFSRVITPLFESMLVQAAEEVGEAQADVSISTEPSTFKPYKKHKSKKQQPKSPKELMDLCTRLSNKVLDLESKVIGIKSSFTARIQKLKDRVDQLKKENKALKEKSIKTTQVDTAAPVKNMEKLFKQGRMIADMDEDVEEAQAKAYNLDLQHAEKVCNMQDIDEEEPTKVEEVLEVVKAAKLMTEVVTTSLPTTTAAQVPKASALKRRRGKEDMKIYLKNMAGFKMDFFKGMTYIEIRPIFEKNYNSIQAFLEKEDEEVIVQEKRQGESLKRETTKKQRIDKDTEELKRHLQIMANDDVFTEATPLASKVLVIDYQIHHENNKPYYKIIREDGTHKLFLSFITLLKNFDREDLEALWKLVKERFETTEPKNFSYDFLLNTLKIMFEKPNVEANMILLVEKKCPLTHFTLQQMLENVRLKVKEKSEMSLELLRLGRRQLNEGYVPE
nr:hypothetical protein [Tanacetum cinerariifolium]